VAATDAHAAASPDFFVAGGTMRPDAPSYVERRSDGELYDALCAGEFAYVLTSRQMGKSSLIVRTAARLREDGVTVAALDLTGLGQNLNAEQWYTGLMSSLGERLDLEDELEDFWDDNEQFGPLHRWMRALRQVVLGAVTGNVVIFIDEIDVVQSLPFSTAELFAAIRECYTRRAEDPDLERLTFCLVGVATPAELIDDPLTTPFNIGKRIELRDFAATDAPLLAAGLTVGERPATVVVERVLHWTGGHPYLTQRLCQLARQGGCRSADEVDGVVAGEFFAGSSRDQEPNLQFVHASMLGRDVDTAALLTLYRRVLRDKQVRYDETNPLINVLRLSGIIRVDGQRTHVRNPIYARVFGREWIDENMPGAELRRQKAAHRRGVLHAGVAATVVLTIVGGLALYAHGLKGQLATKLTETQTLLVDVQLARANDNISPGNPIGLFGLLDAWRTAEGAFPAGTSFASMWAIQHARVSQETSYVKKGQGAVTDMHVSPDGAFAIAGYGDGAVQVWECATGEPLGTVIHGAPVYALRILGGGRYLAVGLADGSVHVWSLATFQRVGPPLPHPKYVSRMAMVGDHTLVTGTSASGKVIVRRWDIVSGLPSAAPLTIPARTPWWDAVWPDGSLLSVPTPTGFGAYDLHSGQAAWDIAAEHDATVLAWCQTGGRLTLALSDGRVLSVDAGGAVLQLPDGPPGADLARFSGDGGVLALASDGSDGGILLWDVAAGRPVGDRLRYTGTADPRTFGFAGSNERVFVDARDGSGAGTLLGWDVQTSQQDVSIAGASEAGERTFIANEVAFRGTAGGSLIRAVRYSPRRGVSLLGVGPGGSGNAAQLALSTDGQAVIIAAAGVDQLLVGHAQVRDTDALAVVHIDQGIRSVAWSSAGSQFAVAAGSSVRVYDTATHELAGDIALNGTSGAVAYDPTGGLLAACNETTAEIWFWDARSFAVAGRAIELPAAVMNAAQNVAFSPDGSRLATGQNDGYVRLWDVETRRALGPAFEHGGLVNGVAFSADGRRIASTNGAGETAKVWDVTTGRQIGPTLRHQGVVWGVAFHPAGELLVVRSNDPGANLWHWQTGTNLSIYMPHPAGVGDAVFSPDGRTLLTVTVAGRDEESRVVRRWSFPPIPTTRREAEVRTSLFTGVRRVGPDDAYVVLTPEDWRNYQAELANMDERPVASEDGSRVSR
jgi:WD40 repeat protein